MLVSAPGKLVLAGEWAILEPGSPGIIAAVNRRVWVRLEEAEEFALKLKDFGLELKAEWNGELKWERNLSPQEEKDTRFIKGAIETVAAYLGRIKPFRLESWGEDVQVEGKKIGFGSSAASTVAAVKAILEFHGVRAEPQLIYKLSALSHYQIQKKLGSGFDVAASTWGGVFVYRRFDPGWLIGMIEERDVKEIVNQKWPGLEVRRLPVPDGLRLLVGWTGESASTTDMIKQMNVFKERNYQEYQRIFKEIAETVKELIQRWEAEDKKGIIELLKRNRNLLSELTLKSRVEIETEKLKRLADIAEEAGGAGKLSGAGGGDCGIAVCWDEETAERIKKGWKEAGLVPLDVGIDERGVG